MNSFLDLYIVIKLNLSYKKQANLIIILSISLSLHRLLFLLQNSSKGESLRVLFQGVGQLKFSTRTNRTGANLLLDFYEFENGLNDLIPNSYNSSNKCPSPEFFFAAYKENFLLFFLLFLDEGNAIKV